MSEVVSISGQSVINIQLQGAGTLNSLFETLRVNDLTFDDPAPGTKINVVAERPSLELVMQKSGAIIANVDGVDLVERIEEIELFEAAKVAITQAGGVILSEECLEQLFTS